MSTLTKMIKQAAANLALEPLEKRAFTPAPGGQIPPPPPGGDPAAGGMPPGGDPMAGGAPPMDPAMMGGMPPGAPMDPAMMGPPPGGDPMAGGAPPMDPAMMGPPPEEGAPADPAANSGDNDYDNDGKPDVMVPLGPITDFATKLIEATKGKRTADAPPPGGAGGGADAAAEGAPPSPAASIGGMPAEAPAPLGGLAMPKMGSFIDRVRKDRGF